MKDFWISCGHHLLDRDDGGGLRLTAEFLKAYLARPELAPPPEACPVERALHSALLSDPRRHIGADEIAAMADPDARDNWQVMLAFRDHLLDGFGFDRDPRRARAAETAGGGDHAQHGDGPQARTGLGRSLRRCRRCA